MQSVRRLAVTDLKQLIAHIYAPHFQYAHCKLSAAYRRKRRLCLQNRSAGCVLSCSNTSRQQEVPTFCLQKQGIPVLSTSLWSEHFPSGIYTSGAHSGSLPPSSRDIGNPISRRLVNTPSRLSSFTLPQVSVAKDSRLFRPQVEQSKIRAGPSSRFLVSWALIAPGSR